MITIFLLGFAAVVSVFWGIIFQLKSRSYLNAGELYGAYLEQKKATAAWICVSFLIFAGFMSGLYGL